jgi:hypothetical protein
VFLDNDWWVEHSSERFLRSVRRVGEARRIAVGRDERLGPGPVGGAVLPDGSFVRNSDMHFDVPLFRQCWKLESPKRELAACSLRRIDSAVNPYVRKHYS